MITFDNGMALEKTGLPDYPGSFSSGVLPFTQSFTVGNNPNRVLIVSFDIFTSTSTSHLTAIASVSYNGIALTQIDNSTTTGAPSAGAFTLSSWFLVNPDAGTHNLIISYVITNAYGPSGGTWELPFAVSSYYNVNQTATPYAHTIATRDDYPTPAPFSAVITTADPNLLIVAMGMSASGFTAGAPNNNFSAFNASSPQENISIADSGIVGAGSHTITTPAETYYYNGIATFTLIGPFPVVTTQAVDTITDISALAHGTIVDDGGTSVVERGFVYSTTTHTLPGNLAPGATAYSNAVTETPGPYSIGAFSDALSGLNPSQAYYVRAYAKNSIGYTYGNEVTFNTLTTLDTIIIRVETDTAGDPSGVLANANATATVAASTLTGSFVDTTVTFAGAFALTAGVKYYVVMSRSEPLNDTKYYQAGYNNAGARVFNVQSFDGGAWNTIANVVGYADGFGFDWITKSDSSKPTSHNFFGFANSVIPFGSSGEVATAGVILMLTGLISNDTYYLGVAGALALTGSVKVGKAIQEDSLLIVQPPL